MDDWEVLSNPFHAEGHHVFDIKNMETLFWVIDFFVSNDILDGCNFKNTIPKFWHYMAGWLEIIFSINYIDVLYRKY